METKKEVKTPRWHKYMRRADGAEMRAIHFSGEPIVPWASLGIKTRYRPDGLRYVVVAPGKRVNPNDYIVIDRDGTLHPVKPDAFKRQFTRWYLKLGPLSVMLPKGGK